MSRPRLLFLVNDARFFLSHRLPIGVAAMNAGFEVQVAAPDRGGEGGRVEAAGICFHPIRMSRSGSRPWEELGTLTRIAAIYRSVRPDLLHHVGFKSIFHGTMASLLCGRPPVVNAVSGLGHMFSLEGRRERTARRIIELGYRLACRRRNQRVIVQNRDDRDLFIERGLARGEHIVLIRGSGVDPERFRPLPQPPGTPLVLFASRLLWTKGVGEFVEAARRLRARGVDARFAIAGPLDPGNLANVQEAELRAWEEEGVAEWWGEREDMPDVMARAHVVCLPTYYREGVPKVLIEAAAAGRSIVASDAPGCREIVRHGENGLLVPPRDPAALADALADLLANAGLRRSMGRRGRELFLEGFTIERVIRETLGLYSDLLRRDAVEETAA